MARADDIAGWLRQQVDAAGARGLALGLSGGIDSALAARLCQMAVPGDVVGVVMPCHSDPRDEADARLLAAHVGIPTVRIDLGPAYDRIVLDLQGAVAQLAAEQRADTAPQPVDIKARVPLANVKPRLRMTAVYFVANVLNYLVVGTGNRCELTIGYFTKYGDGGVDLLPLGRLLKSEVRAMARELGVPDSIIDKPPSAGLWIGQTDEDEMGFTYAELETYLTSGPNGVARALALRIERLERASQHKRALAQMPDLA